MSKTVQWKRGNANVSSAYIGAQGEITVDTSEWGLRVHDGLTAGGYKISNDTDSNVNVGNLNINNQTIQGNNSNQDVQIVAIGAANVVLSGQTTVVSNDIYVQGNGTIDGILIQNSTISTVSPNVNLVLTSGNVSTTGNFYANILRLKNENFYIAEVFSGALSRNITSIFSGLSYPEDITIRANNTIVGLHTSAVGTMGIRSFASNTVPVTIGGNTLVQGNVTANGYSAPEYSSYLFGSNAASVSGITHRIFSNTANVNIFSIVHDNAEVARFFSNNQTQLTGNLIIIGGTGVSNQTVFPEARIQVYSNINTYSQIVHQNLNSGSLSSSDYVATANNGNDTTYYIDLGIAGNLHSDSAFFGDTTTFNDAYLYVVGYNQAGPSLGNVGNLIIGSTNGLVKTFVGNTAQANVVTVVDSTGLLPGANVTYNLGSATRQWKDLWLSNSTMYLGGFPITVSNTGVLSVNGSPVSSNAGSYGNANVASYLPTYNGNIAGNIVKNGYSWTFGPEGTLTLPGNLTTSSNITANYFIGNGSLLTGLSATYSNSNVASYMTTYGGPINANIITGTANATVNGLTVNTSGVFTTTLRAAGGLQNTPIGNVAGQASSGSFTTITANGNLTVAGIASNGTITATTIGAATIGNASAVHTGATYYASGNYYGVLGAASFANAATVTTLSANGNATVNGLTVNTSGVFTTTLQAAGGLQNTPIGNVAGQASSGSFTTITANGNLTVAGITSNGTITATTIGAATIGNASAVHTGATYYASGNYYGILGAASFANAATVTTLSANGNVTASAMAVNNSATVGTTLGVTGNATVGNLSTVGVIVGNASPGATGTISNAVGYLGIPQNSQSTSYTLALADQGRHIYLTANSNITIPANSSVSFPIGSAITVVNGPNVQSNVLITTDTLYLAANGATGTRNISTYGMATLVKVTNTIWYINGSGIT